MSSQVTINLSKQLKKIARNLEKKITQASGERLAFTLVIYSPGRAQYISNCDRQESIQQLEYLLEQWKKNMPDVPAHKIN